MKYQDLMSDKWAWGIAHRFNRKYYLGFDLEELRSEVNMCVFAVHQKIETNTVNFGWDDSEQVLKYFRIIIRNHLCDLARKKKQTYQNEIQITEDFVWNNISFDLYKKDHKDLTTEDIIGGFQDNEIYNYIIRYCTHTTKKERKELQFLQEKLMNEVTGKYEGLLRNFVIFNLRNVKDTDQLQKSAQELIEIGTEMKNSMISVTDECQLATVNKKMQRIYRRHGKDGINLVNKCRYSLAKKDRKENIMGKVEGIYGGEVRWLCHLLAQEAKKKEDLQEKDLDKDIVIEYAKKIDTPFGRRLLKWVEGGMKIIRDPNDCFLAGFERDDKDCVSCPLFEECSKALKWAKEALPDLQSIKSSDQEKQLEKSQTCLDGLDIVKKKSCYVVQSKPKIYILSSIDADLLSCNCSRSVKSILEKMNIEFKEYKDGSLAFKITKENLAQLVNSMNKDKGK